MEQTGGLFHPLLSQGIYPSNQGLKLSAQAFWLPKGAFICLKSRGLPNDSKVDMKQEELLSFWVRPVSPSSAPPPFLPALVSIWLYLSCPSFQSDTSFNSGFQLTGPAKSQGPACPGQSASPHSGRWTLENQAGWALTGGLMVAIGARVVATSL